MIYKGNPYVVSPYTFRRGRFESNPVGSDVVAYITTTPPDSTLDGLLTKLAEEYDVDMATLEADVCAFIDDCIAKDILINHDLEAEGREVVRNIRKIQEGIPELTISKFGYVSWLGKQVTPGCQSCGRGKWAVFSVGLRCNLSCWFCPFTGSLEKTREDLDLAPEPNGVDTIGFLGMRFSHRELKFQFSLIHDKFDAFAWLGGEPMMPPVLERILPLIAYFHESYPDYHQWLYTNGGYATKDNMQKLYDAGIRELRFNLAAAKFSRKVIARMKEARRIFDHVCMEVPMTKASYEGLMAHADEILDTGLDQMNLNEFIVGQNHLTGEADLKDEGKLYSYKGFISSPIRSRQYTYEIIQRAVKEKWPVVINDCSNEYKYYKLSIQENKGINIFQGRRGYWNNEYSLADIDRFNDGLASPDSQSDG
jgi:pyruvate formate-lyase activating enzyme-like uncharacterized protein